MRKTEIDRHPRFRHGDRGQRLFLSSLPQFDIVALRALCLIAASPAFIAHWARRPPPPRTAHVVMSRTRTARATPTRTAHDMLQITLGGAAFPGSTGPLLSENSPPDCFPGLRNPSKPPGVFWLPDILCCTIYLEKTIGRKREGMLLMIFCNNPFIGGWERSGRACVHIQFCCTRFIPRRNPGRRL